MGTSARSSWLPMPDEPLAASTPITRKGWLLMRMVLPTADDASPKRVVAVVLPSTTTSDCAVTWADEIPSPSATV